MHQFSTKSKTDLLIKQALEHLGIDLAEHKDDRDAVIAAIKENGGSFGNAPKTTDQEQAAAPKGKELTHVTIEVQHSGDEGEEDFIQVGLNGTMYQIKKGVEVKVPVGVYNVLNDAVEIKYRKSEEKDEHGMQQLISIKKKRHAFSVTERHYADAAE